MLVLREPWISSYSWSVMSILFFKYCLSSGGDFPSFFSLHLLAVCVYPFITLVSCLIILCVLGLWEFLWRAGSFSFCVELRCVECRAGTIYLGASLGWMAGLYRFSFLWLCCSGYGTIEMVGGGGPFFFSLSSVCCQLSWRAVVYGRTPFFFISIFFGYLLVLFAVSYFISC
jgi:hypothetical protein